MMVVLGNRPSRVLEATVHCALSPPSIKLCLPTSPNSQIILPYFLFSFCPFPLNHALKEIESFHVSLVKEIEGQNGKEKFDSIFFYQIWRRWAERRAVLSHSKRYCYLEPCTTVQTLSFGLRVKIDVRFFYFLFFIF
jgi:hypothetical protein